MARVFDLEARVKDDPVAAREALRQLFKNGRITLEVGADVLPRRAIE